VNEKNRWRHMRLASDRTIALDECGHLHCWGDNWCGQCDIPEWVRGQRIVSTSHGFGHSAAVTHDGRFAVWGRNSDFQIPPSDPDLKVRSACAFANCTCIVDASGSLSMFGNTDRYYRASHLRGTNVTWAASTKHHVIIRMENGRFEVMGNPHVTRTNIKTEIAKAIPVKISTGIGDFATISSDGVAFLFDLTGSLAHFKKHAIPGIQKDIEMHGDTLMALDEKGFISIHGKGGMDLLYMPWDLSKEAWVDAFMNYGLRLRKVLPQFIREMDGYDQIIKMQAMSA
jgi:hypothetical protein